MNIKHYLSIAALSILMGCSDNSITEKKPQDSLATPTAPLTAAASNDINEATTKAVLEHHWKAFSGNDLNEVMADYTEESVLITPDKTYKGLEEIKANFIDANKKFPKDKSTFTLSKTVIDRDLAYILWQSKTPTFNLSFATDSFIIRDGKIVRQTYAGVATPL